MNAWALLLGMHAADLQDNTYLFRNTQRNSSYMPEPSLFVARCTVGGATSKACFSMFG